MKVRFRAKGEVTVHEFIGNVIVAGEQVEWSQLPLHDDVLDLTHLPVKCIGGRKGRRQKTALEVFQAQAPDFKGVIYLLPYSWTNGWSDGHLYVPSWDALLDKSKRIFGGRPEVELTNYRWLSDGRYVADRARMLHGKVIEVFNAEVEQDVPMDELVRELSNWHGHVFSHTLRDQCLAVWRDIFELEQRRTVFAGEQSRRDVAALIRELLTEKFRKSDVRKVADIPADFSITVAEVAPELTAQADTLGMVEVPGVGRKLAERARTDFGYNEVPTVTLTIEEFRLVTSWSLSIYPVIAEIGSARHQLQYELRDALEASEAERLLRLRAVLAGQWREFQRGSNFPKDILLPDPKKEDMPPTPEPVEWGFDLLTGEKFIAYPYLFKQYREGGWTYRWKDSLEEAEKFGASYRQEAESFMASRHMEAELTAEAEAMELPVPLPEPFAAPEAEREEAEASYRTKVREFVEVLRRHPNFSLLSEKMREKLGWYADSLWEVPNLTGVADALRAEWARAEALRRRASTGEVLTNYGGYFRVMGRTRNSQYWVIRPDGAERDPDEVSYRKRYTSEGSKRWRLVGPEELAISWSKSDTRSHHQFKVDKLPASGCTPEQLATIEHLEREISERFEGAIGMSGDPSPDIGAGWGFRQNRNLKPEAAPTESECQEADAPPESAEPVSPSKVDLSKLFGGGVKIRR